MIQREVTDKENTKWTCVQAFTGMQEKLAEKAAEISKENGKVPVVCTPTGGAQSVRLDLSENWNEELQDDELVNAINNAAK
jgi:DNA-binding protein YbaB